MNEASGTPCLVDRFHALLREPIVFDGRNVYEPHRIADLSGSITTRSGGRTALGSNRQRWCVYDEWVWGDGLVDKITLQSLVRKLRGASGIELFIISAGGSVAGANGRSDGDCGDHSWRLAAGTINL